MMKRLIPPDDCPEEIARRLEAIEQHRALNAILGVNPDAMTLAEAYQKQRRRGERIGPLHGVPLIIKDNIACAPMPVTLGCRALGSLQATSDARGGSDYSCPSQYVRVCVRRALAKFTGR